MPTLTLDPPGIQCRVEVRPGERCMLPPDDHPRCRHCGGDLGHEYVSLMTPCLGCPALISWSAPDGRRDTTGRFCHSTEPGMEPHRPDPRYLP